MEGKKKKKKHLGNTSGTRTKRQRNKKIRKLQVLPTVLNIQLIGVVQRKKYKLGDLSMGG